MDILSSAQSLPRLLTFADAKTVRSAADWSRRREQVLETVLSIEYGNLPPSPEAVDVYELHVFRTLSGVEGTHYQLTAQPVGFQFAVTVYRPEGSGPFPAIIDGDECWGNHTNEVIDAIVGHGFMLAVFSRVEIVPDNFSSARDAGLYLAYPEGVYGALAAWAWGYHRVVDALLAMPSVDPARIVVTGHSRGGKAALLAGAADERIALTAPNNSGCGGAGSFHYPDKGGETLDHIGGVFPYWFTPALFQYTGRVAELPFDQHFVKALVAPRALLTTEALADVWASPRGTFITHTAAKDVFDLLGTPQSIGIWYREGGHAHTLDDWHTLIDFAGASLNGQPTDRDYQANRWE